MYKSFRTKIIWPGWLGGVREGLGQKVKNVKLFFAKKSLHISYLVQTAVYTERHIMCSTRFVTLPKWILSSHLNENIPWSCATVLRVSLLAPSGALIAILTYYWPHFFRSHRSSTLDFHFLSHYSYIKAIMLCKGKTWQDSGILWNTLAYYGILWHTLA